MRIFSEPADLAQGVLSKDSPGELRLLEKLSYSTATEGGWTGDYAKGSVNYSSFSYKQHITDV